MFTRGGRMTASANSMNENHHYEVGVAIVPFERWAAGSDPGEERVASIPGYEDLRGTGRREILIQKGEDAVSAATEALASQIATSAGHIAKVINEKISSAPHG